LEKGRKQIVSGSPSSSSCPLPMMKRKREIYISDGVKRISPKARGKNERKPIMGLFPMFFLSKRLFLIPQ